MEYIKQHILKKIILLTLNIGFLIAGNYSYPVPNYTPGSYNNRSFLSPTNHLGEDIKLKYNTPIHAIGTGIIKKYSAASGYGTLVVAIEHDLKENKTFHLKIGQQKTVTVRKFVSIYGHLKKGNLKWKVGQKVNKGDIIGYVQTDALNGDGAEHLHFGIFLDKYRGVVFGYTSNLSYGLFKYAKAKYFASGKEFINFINKNNDFKIYDFWQSANDGIYQASCYKNDWILDAQFKIKNISNSDIYIEKLALAVHDINNNYLFDLAVRDIYQILYQNDSLHFDIAKAYLTKPGKYKLIAKVYYNNSWHNLDSINFTVIKNNNCSNNVEDQNNTTTNQYIIADIYIKNFYNEYNTIFGNKVKGPYDCYDNYRCTDYDTGYKIAVNKQDLSLYYYINHKWYKY